MDRCENWLDGFVDAARGSSIGLTAGAAPRARLSGRSQDQSQAWAESGPCRGRQEFRNGHSDDSYGRSENTAQRVAAGVIRTPKRASFAFLGSSMRQSRPLGLAPAADFLALVLSTQGAHHYPSLTRAIPWPPKKAAIHIDNDNSSQYQERPFQSGARPRCVLFSPCPL